MKWINIKNYIKNFWENLIFWKNYEENDHINFLYTSEGDFVEVWEENKN